VNLAGTWSAPVGTVTGRVQRLQLLRLARPMPAVEDIDVVADVNPERARVTRLAMAVEGQPARITPRSRWARISGRGCAVRNTFRTGARRPGIWKSPARSFPRSPGSCPPQWRRKAKPAPT